MLLRNLHKRIERLERRIQIKPVMLWGWDDDPDLDRKAADARQQGRDVYLVKWKKPDATDPPG